MLQKSPHIPHKVKVGQLRGRECVVGLSILLYLIIAKEKQLDDPQLRAVFTNPVTGLPWLAGDVYYRRDLADTLEQLAKVILHSKHAVAYTVNSAIHSEL